MFFLFVLMFQAYIFEDHKEANSYEDVIINDINNPFTLEEIENIIDLKVYHNYYGDLTNFIEREYDNYTINIDKEGIFNISYKLEYENIKEYYVVLIYNIDLSKYNKFERIDLETTLGKHLEDYEILNKILEKLNVKIYSYEVIESNYINSNSVGKYYKSFILRTTNNEVINVLVEIDVLKESENNLIIISIVSVIAILIITSVSLKIIKKRRINNV